MNFVNVAENVEADLNPHANATSMMEQSPLQRSSLARSMRMRTT